MKDCHDAYGNPDDRDLSLQSFDIANVEFHLTNYLNGYDDNRKDVYFEDLSVEGQYQPVKERPSRRLYGRYHYEQNTDEEYTCPCEDD